jgi:two-component system, chemotaxis family, protein-glutamate methylesterase/glutaminase
VKRDPELFRRVADAQVIVIGASLGGTSALRALFGALTGAPCAAVVVAQHRHRNSTDRFAEMLRGKSGLRIFDAEDGMRLDKGTIYLAPPDYHLMIDRGVLKLSTEAPVQFTRPSIDVLFESAADSYGRRLVAVVLTGSNNDGAAGARRVHEKGGVVLVQDPKTAEAPAMPEAAAAHADVIGTLPEIAALMCVGGTVG